MERTVDWDAGVIVAVDQRALPHEYRMLRLTTADELVDAIQQLAIRGAPALGAAGALGVAQSTHRHRGDEAAVRAEAARLADARPTAANLAWGVDRALSRLPEGPEAVLREALAVLDEDEQVNRQASRRAADLVLRLSERRPLRVLTHCNTGRLATVAWGTALGAVRHLAEARQIEYVLATETRPLLQGSRLTAYELDEAGIPYQVCTDSAAPAAVARGLVDCVLVGADRIAANGDVANKIGTYAIALAAARHGVPFVVVAPESTVDGSLPDGRGVRIEERAADEVTHFAGQPVAPAGADAFNPAFEVTPADLVTAIVTEERVYSEAAARSMPEAPSVS
ncbi:MAG: S-methyl-5-thioribose-1-phosphate isomerase [Actinomycetota bacterium]